jgi:hypothetical protein
LLPKLPPAGTGWSLSLLDGTFSAVAISHAQKLKVTELQ